VIIKEYRCRDCNTFFESADKEPFCPHCTADEPERAFLTPPGFKSPKTAVADREIRNLASDFGLSDVSNRYGEAVKRAPGPEQATFAGPQAINNFKIPQNARDGLSPVLPTLQAMGGPRNWTRTPDRGRK
jgi:hypothetical protein